MKKLIILALLNFSLPAHSVVNELKSVGPNSLNAALLVAGLVNNYRYSSSAEMWTTLNSSICRRLEKNEGLQVRDLGIIFGNKTLQNTSEISHAFVLINNHLAYEKINSNINSGYQVKPIAAILQRFGLAANLNYYRCQTLEQFVVNKTSLVKSYARAALKDVETIEAGLQNYLSSYGLPENKNKYLEIERQLQIVARKMSDISESEFEGDILISKIIARRYVSIAAQIKALGHPEFYNLVQPWELQDKNIFQVFNLIVQMRIQDDLDLFYLNLRQFFVSVYGPIVQSIRHVPLNLSLTEEYADNAGGASLYKDNASIQLGYDLHHFSQITPDAYLAILCHETGHLLGGPPYFQNGPSQQWASETPASTEGQSDYFSSLVCMKKIFAEEAKASQMDFDVTPEVVGLCAAKFPVIKDQNICQRSVRAGYELMNYIMSVFDRYTPGIILPRPNMNVSEPAGASFGRLYPSFQCRFDTIKAGALNEKRPECWFTEADSLKK